MRASPVFAFDDVVGFGPDAVYVAFLDQKTLEGVVLSPDDLLMALAFFNGENRRKRLVFDLHGVHSFRQEVLVRMGKQQDRLFGMIDHFIRQTWLIVGNQCDAICARNVFRRNDDKFVPWDFRSEVNCLDSSTRRVAAHCGAIYHSGQNHVIDVLRASRDLFAAFLARNVHADDGFAFHAEVETTNVVNSRPAGSPGKAPSEKICRPRK